MNQAYPEADMQSVKLLLGYVGFRLAKADSGCQSPNSPVSQMDKEVVYLLLGIKFVKLRCH